MPSRLPVVVALLLLVSGCSALPGGRAPSDERALDVRDRALSSVENVSTYRFTVDGRVSASDGDRTRTVEVTGRGAADRRQRRMVATTAADGSNRSTYVDGRTVYTRCAEPWDGWSVENASDSTEWLGLTPLGRQLAILERSAVYWGGAETRDGQQTLRIVAHPSKETLASLPDVGGTTANDYSSANVQNATFEVWVDARTGRPVESRFRIELSTGGASGVAELRTRYRGYGEPVSISLPPSTQTDQYELGCPGE
jgi:hypothetical protein